MDNQTFYGKQVFILTFAEATGRGIICNSVSHFGDHFKMVTNKL